MPNYNKTGQYTGSVILQEKNRPALRTTELFIAFGAFDVAAAFVFPIMVAVCSQIYPCGHIGYRQDDEY
jgi:hypothetical protein